MADTNDPDTTDPEAGTPPAADDGQQNPPDGQQQQENPNAEAARYRTQLRAAEAERDTLAERLTSYQRRAAEAAIADILDEPGDLFDIGGVDLAAQAGSKIARMGWVGAGKVATREEDWERPDFGPRARATHHPSLS